MSDKTNSTAKNRKRAEAPNPAAHEANFPIVGVGASAGGLEAFTRLLRKLPADTGMAFVLVQHLDPKHVSLMHDLEQRALNVIETMIPQSQEIQDRQGHWYALRIRPYKTMDNRIEGAVMAFIDIDSIKDAERYRATLRQERRLAAVLSDANDAVMERELEK